MLLNNLNNSIDDCNGDQDHGDHDQHDHNPGVDQNNHADLSDSCPSEGIDDGLDALDYNSDVRYIDDCDDGFMELTMLLLFMIMIINLLTVMFLKIKSPIMMISRVIMISMFTMIQNTVINYIVL